MLNSLVSGIKVLHIVAGLDESHGGPSYSVPRLGEALRNLDVCANLCVVGECDSVAGYSFPQDFVRTPLLKSLRISSALSNYLNYVAPLADLVHVHGLWLMPNVYAGRVAGARAKPLIVSPRGMVSPGALGFSRWRKKVFWAFVQGPAYAGAACWHATSEMEAQEIRNFGVRAPVAVIPNGIDIPNSLPGKQEQGNKCRSILSLGRIHPKKGLANLIKAWTKVAARYPDWEMKIIGPDENGYAAQLRLMATSLSAPRISIQDAIYGEGKWKALARADLFVLPSVSENFGLTVAESLAAGTPAIASTGTPWEGLSKHNCGWWVDCDIDTLAATLDTAMSLSKQELSTMGKKGRNWMTRDFSWSKVAEEMISIYQWLLGAGSQPKIVHL